MKTDSILANKQFRFLLLASIVIVLGLFFLLRPQDRTAINFIAIISSVITFLAFYITLNQIQSVKAIALQTEAAVNSKLKDYNRLIFISEISSKISIISELKGYLRKGQFEICIVRMEDFKKVLASLNASAELLNVEIDAKAVRVIFRNYNIDMNSIEKKLENASYPIEVNKIISNMENLSFFLQNIEVKLKQN